MLWNWVALTLSVASSDPAPKPSNKPVVVAQAAAAPAPAPAAVPKPTPAPGISADEAVKKLQAFYQSTQKLKADFKQTYTNAVFGRTSTSTGKLYVMKPGKMRWDYKTPDEKHFISDGATLWIYEKAAKQAGKQELKDTVLPVAITFLFGQGDLARDFAPSLDPGKYGAPKDIVVKLVPRQPTAQYKHLWLVLDPGDFHVKESVILEASDNVNHFKFHTLRQNKDVPVTEKHFKFTVPPGVKVVRADEITPASR